MSNEHSTAEEPAVSYDRSYTYGDYINFNFDYMVELIRGKLFKMSPSPSTKHQKAVGQIYVKFMIYLENRKCEALIAPFDVVLPVQNQKDPTKNNTVVQPDMVLVCDLSMLNDANCFGAPDLLT